MKQFLTPVRLVLTPLSPIHIGLGEDFDPTSYIIDDNGILYVFDPSRAFLPEELRQKLLVAAGSANMDSIHRIYKIFYDYKDLFIPLAHTFIPVAEGVADKYKNSLGKPVQIESRRRKVFNYNYIERAMFLPSNGQPYLPGSSVKGAVRTAWLEALHTKSPHIKPDTLRPSDVAEFEKILLHGNFNKSPLRLLKIADFMPQHDIDRKIIFSRNIKKTQHVANTGNNEKLKTRKEVALSGQYRAFVSDTVLTVPGVQDSDSSSSLPPIVNLAQYCNKYYLPRFDKEYDLLRNNSFAGSDWLKRLKAMLGALQHTLTRGDMFLLRLGRHTSAENKTIKDIAKISIKGKRGEQPRIASKATTLWLAADKDNQTTDMLPFGWALVEVNPRSDCEPLRAWCDEERKGRPNIQTLRDQLTSRKQKIADERAARQADAEAQKAKKQEEIEARERKAAELAAMSVAARKLMEFCKTLGNHPPLKQNNAGAAILCQVAEFLEQATAFPKSDQLACAEKIAPLLKAKNMYLGKRKKQFKAALQVLRG